MQQVVALSLGSSSTSACARRPGTSEIDALGKAKAVLRGADYSSILE